MMIWSKELSTKSFSQENDALIRRMMTGMRKKIQFCIEKNGGHVEGK